MIEYLNLVLILIIGIAVVIIGIKVFNQKDNFATTSAPAWYTNRNILLSDSKGNLSSDTTDILKNYIDKSLSNSISTLEGTGYATTTTLASLQTAYDTLNKWVTDYCITNNQDYYISGTWGASAPYQLRPNYMYSNNSSDRNTVVEYSTTAAGKTGGDLDTSKLDSLFKFKFTNA